jgi:small conductance mechanosensitive channel
MDAMSTVSNLWGIVVQYAGRLILAAVVFFGGRQLVNLAINLTERRMSKVNVDESLHTFLSSLLRMALQALLLLSVAATAGIEVTSFVALIGAAGLAIGLAFQGSLSNFAGGVLILLLKPFKVGDFIEAGGYSGTVKEIQVFYTILHTPDNQKVILPNSTLSNATTVNYSANPIRRANIKVLISYDSDIQQVKEVLLNAAKSIPQVLDDPAPFVAFGEFNPHGMVFYVRVWAPLPDFWTCYFKLHENIKEGLDAAGIEIPYDQLDVHLRQEAK